MNQFTYVAHTVEDTERLGAALAELLPDGTTIALCGTLGAGKTRLVQAVAAHCGVSRQEVVSPTFVLCQEYQATRQIYHFDAYRLASEEEFGQLGAEEAFHSPALVFIEWAERVERLLPAERIEIQIDLGEDEVRRFTIIAHGEQLAPVVAALAERLAGSK